MNPAEVATAHKDIGVSIIFMFIILDLPFLVTIVHTLIEIHFTFGLNGFY